MWLKRVALASLLGILALNVWTGGPLLALWAGSQVQGSGPPSMRAVFVVVVVLAAVSLVLVRLLTVVGAAYDRLVGARATVRTHAPWLRSLRGERELYTGEQPHLTALERTLVIMVIIAVAVFEIWFFFFSTSPIDQRSGRGAIRDQSVLAAVKSGTDVRATSAAWSSGLVCESRSAATRWR